MVANVNTGIISISVTQEDLSGTVKNYVSLWSLEPLLDVYKRQDRQSAEAIGIIEWK